ncbi:MAG: hypothetical protein K5864_02865 [Bacteroidales bacterium]|nr:hypothetical protein [Bacteroidales bacterium]
MADICRTCKTSSPKKMATSSKAAVCKRAQSTAELNINNVRALINGYGNMWYDGSVTQYHIPKDGTSTPMYCAALWIGGTDVNEQLRLAALRFGSEGDDYWPGPLTIDGTADITIEVCNYYDRHYKITQSDVVAFNGMFDWTANGPVPNENYNDADIAQVIKEWPAHGNFENQSYYLAPFKDVDGDGTYNYQAGDYPYYDFDNELCPRTLKASLADGENYHPAVTMEDSAGIVKGGLLSDQVLKGDQTIWWVFNDMGNTHTESKGQPIGMEIRAQAFAFATNDEINNMTFYSYEIINRSTYELRNTYFSQWVDPDLGYGYDDYVGCDVKRGLGYCYNGKDIDGPGTGSYSGIPPAIGIDFFQGPYMDADGRDNPRVDINKMLTYYPTQLATYALTGGGYDTIRLNDDADLYYPDAWYFQQNDSVGNCAINGVNFGNNIIDDERFGMRRFVYYDNSVDAVHGEPSKATDYYNYLRGYWKNGARMKYGGNAINVNTTTLDCDFMFPGDSDPLHWGTNGNVPESNPDDWTEKTAGNTPRDVRFMQSAGPFTLKPGALNYITVGIPFAQATSGSAWTSVELLREIDDVCQSLFENCFKVLDGPDAPTLVAQELKNEIILYITYENPNSNNYGEKYHELDPSIVSSYIDAQGNKVAYTNDERSYDFEGYQIFQLIDANASIADINDETKARLVAQCDIKNFYDAEQTLPIGTLVNYTNNSTTGLISGQIMVNGANNGIQHVFRVTTDQFANGTNTTLVNNKEYYYICVAYAHNRYKEYSQTDASKLDGQKEPYLAGRKNEKGRAITPITAIPHDPITENGGTVAQATFGLCPNITRIEGFGNGGMALELTEASLNELMGAPGQPAKAPGTFNERLSGGSYSGSMSDPCLIPNPQYEQNAGPINVRVIDPLSIKQGQFYIKFDDYTDTAHWVISTVDGSPLFDSVYSDTSDFVIGRYNEQLFLDLGIAVSITNPKAIASDLIVSGTDVKGGIVGNEAVISANMTFADVNHQWLSGITDNDNYMLYNWVRSGAQYAASNLTTFDNKSTPISMSEAYLDDDYYKSDYNQLKDQTETHDVDKYQIFEDVLGGLWAPYGLCSALPYHPAFSFRYYIADSSVIDSLRSVRPNDFKYNYHQLMRRTSIHTRNKSIMFNDLSKLPSVRIVLTADKTKWTRCPVLEMCDDYTQAEGKAHRFQLRKHASVDKNGDTATVSGASNDPNSPNYISDRGMGWFPGYAINLATGERLNIMFGEDSRYVQYNGRDMLWNPVQTISVGTENYVMGGRHYIYVMNAISQDFPRYHVTADSYTKATYKSPSYDAGRWAVKMLQSLDHLYTIKNNEVNQGLLRFDGAKYVLPVRDSAAFLFSTVSWVNMPLATETINKQSDIPCDVTIDLNVYGRYGNYYGNNGSNPLNVGKDTLNSNNPMYMFELTDDIVTLTNQALANNKDAESYKDSLLSMIYVVPNPYYSASTLETGSQLETKVRFINVPANSTITIYTVDGTVVRRFRGTPSNQTTYDWDLHNSAGTPIAGGLYLIHFECPGIGERVIKWFGTMRPVDLNNFQF